MTPSRDARTTVVIATRDRAGELARTLRRLLALRPRPPIVVVDNASTDDTAEDVLATRPDPAAVRLLRLPDNAGAAARNVGVVAADTPYVAFSDDDSWWAPGALPRAADALDRHPRIGLVAARTLVGPGERPDPVDELLAGSPLGTEPGLPGPSVLGFLACSAVVRRSAFDEVGGFSPLLHFGAEETLLAYDLAAAGWVSCYLAEVRAHHHPAARRMAPARRARLERRNHALISWLRRPPAYCVRSAAGLLRDPVAAAGALRRLPRALAGRSPLPSDVERKVRVLEG
ncbi:glycosyltransferase [Amycolatopsis aidingensis]|uniref:glycosyltransferase n=1 Tax=Amycolatopsis aidingensis TaxID=2842453 RepID=UPI001C0D87DD|nr:glycosyltransferase [Amycolatopsis aidingensis]